MISEAQAQSMPTASVGGFDLMSLLPLALIFVVFYFFLIRPQQKKVQEQKNLISSLRRGDRVVTSGGIIGLITKNAMMATTIKVIMPIMIFFMLLFVSDTGFSLIQVRILYSSFSRSIEQ